MSANNFILIEWKKDHYEVSHRDADTSYVFDRIANEGNLEDAVRKANDFIRQEEEQGNYVEYGINIIQRPRNATTISGGGNIRGQEQKTGNDNQTE